MEENTILKQILGWLIISLLAVPLLFGIIWAHGMTRAATSKALIIDTPKQIISKIPDVVQTAFEEAQKPDAINDPTVQTWVDAMAKAPVTPMEFFSQTGIYSWLQTEVSSKFDEAGQILNGQIPPHDITLDTTPIKEALLGSETGNYIKGIIEQLPLCSREEMLIWQRVIHKEADQTDTEELPTCNPGPLVVTEGLKQFSEKNNTIPDQVEITHGLSSVEKPFISMKYVSAISWTLFIIPAAFILLGCFLVSSSNSFRLKAAGLTVFLTGLASYLLSYTLQNASKVAVGLTPVWQYDTHSVFSVGFQQAILSQVSEIIISIFQIFLAPVINTSLYILITGIILFGISFLVHEKEDTSGIPVPVVQPKPEDQLKQKAAKRSTKKPSNT